MQTLVGDAFIVSLGSHIYVVKALTGNVSQLYRLNLVWNGDKRIVPPILICFIASIGERRWRLSECKHMDDWMALSSTGRGRHRSPASICKSFAQCTCIQHFAPEMDRFIFLPHIIYKFQLDEWVYFRQGLDGLYCPGLTHFDNCSIDCFPNMADVPTDQRPCEFRAKCPASNGSDYRIWIHLFSLPGDPPFALPLWKFCAIYLTWRSKHSIFFVSTSRIDDSVGYAGHRGCFLCCIW